MPYWAWLALGLALAATEVVASHFVLIWFGLAALVVGGLVWAVPDLSWTAELIIFSVASLLLVVPGRYVRARLRRVEGRDIINDRPAQHVGRVLVLTEPIVNGSGRIFIGDTLWRIRGPDLPAGTAVRVTRSAGSVLEVRAEATPKATATDA